MPVSSAKVFSQPPKRLRQRAPFERLRLERPDEATGLAEGFPCGTKGMAEVATRHLLSRGELRFGGFQQRHQAGDALGQGVVDLVRQALALAQGACPTLCHRQLGPGCLQLLDQAMAVLALAHDGIDPQREQGAKPCGEQCDQQGQGCRRSRDNELHRRQQGGEDHDPGDGRTKGWKVGGDLLIGAEGDQEVRLVERRQGDPQGRSAGEVRENLQHGQRPDPAADRPEPIPGAEGHAQHRDRCSVGPGGGRIGQGQHRCQAEHAVEHPVPGGHPPLPGVHGGSSRRGVGRRCCRN